MNLRWIFFCKEQHKKFILEKKFQGNFKANRKVIQTARWRRTGEVEEYLVKIASICSNQIEENLID